MKPVVFTYTVGLKDYRKLLYFNTFSIRRWQSLFVIIVWLAAVVLLLLELFGIIAPTQIMHLCFLIVTVAIPMILVSLEIRVQRSRGADPLTKSRTVIIDDKGIHYRTDDSYETGLDPWDELLAVYETRSLFIIYKDAQNLVPLPKKDMPKEQLEKIRAALQQHLGKKYKRR